MQTAEDGLWPQVVHARQRARVRGPVLRQARQLRRQLRQHRPVHELGPERFDGAPQPRAGPRHGVPDRLKHGVAEDVGARVDLRQVSRYLGGAEGSATRWSGCFH